MASLFPNQDQNGTIVGPNPLGSVTLGLGDMMLNGEPLEIFESNGYIVIKAVGSNGKILLIDPETGLVMDLLMGNETSCGSYCYKNQQAEWGNDLGNIILNNGPAINRAIETGEAVAADWGQNDMGDTVLGIASSVMISVGVALLIATGPTGWLALGLIGLGMAGCFFAADLDENPLSTSNWMKFGLMVGPSLIPVYGAEAAIGSKIGWNALKTSLPTYTRKGLMSSAPVGTNLVGSIKNVLGQTYTTITQSLTNKEVIRLTCGDSVKSSLVNGLSNTPISLTDRTCVVIDEYSEEIDRWVSARYNSFEDYILQGPASLIP